MLGLDLGADDVAAKCTPLLEAAQRVDGFVRIDMEGSAYTDATWRYSARSTMRFPLRSGS